MVEMFCKKSNKSELSTTSDLQVIGCYNNSTTFH